MQYNGDVSYRSEDKVDFRSIDDQQDAIDVAQTERSPPVEKKRSSPSKIDFSPSDQHEDAKIPSAQTVAMGEKWSFGSSFLYSLGLITTMGKKPFDQMPLYLSSTSFTLLESNHFNNNRFLYVISMLLFLVPIELNVINFRKQDFSALSKKLISLCTCQIAFMIIAILNEEPSFGGWKISILSVKPP